MKYKIVNEQIKEDNNILADFSDSEVAEIMGTTRDYIWRLRNGQRTASEDFYLELKRKIENHKKSAKSVDKVDN